MPAKIKTNYFEQLLSLTKRHLLVFVNSRIRMFFTLMVPFIIFVIYIFFLRDLELMTIEPVLSQYGLSMEDAELKRYVYTLVDSWMLSGIIAMCTITVSLQINTITVCDKENGINRDFASSPVSPHVLIFSYFLANFIITFVVCLVFLVACLIYLAAIGELIMTFTAVVTILGVLIFATVNGVLFTVFICSFVSHDQTMASVITIFSTAIGFLIGAYMPLFMMPEPVQYVCGFVPGTYACALFRFAFMNDTINAMAAYGIGNKVNGLITLPSNAIGSAVGTIVGQNMGARQPERAAKGYRIAMYCAIVFLFVGGQLLALRSVSQTIVGIFASDPEVVSLATDFLSLMAAWCWTNGIYNATSGLFQGSGHTEVTMAVDASRLWVFRFATLYFCQRLLHMGVESVWYSVVVSNGISSAILLGLYFTGLWRKSRFKTDA